jgi:hypothetical protein
LNTGKESNFFNSRRVTAHQMITTFTQFIDQTILVAFEIFDTTPGQI